jgi:hypothetical protein
MLFVNLTAPTGAEYTFRNTKWGMSIKEVIDNETLSLVSRSENTLIYRVHLHKKDTLLVYKFEDSELQEINYTINEVYPNENDYIKDYSLFKKILTKRYGPPIIDREVWKDELFKDTISDWGTAVSLSHLFFHSEWKTNNSNIQCILIGQDSNIACAIQYTREKSPSVQ